MMAKPKYEPHQDETYRGKRRRQENALDEALKNTFPASDPSFSRAAVVVRRRREKKS